MFQYDVGVRIERTVEIKRIDSDYFEEVRNELTEYPGLGTMFHAL